METYNYENTCSWCTGVFNLQQFGRFNRLSWSPNFQDPVISLFLWYSHTVVELYLLYY